MNNYGKEMAQKGAEEKKREVLEGINKRAGWLIEQFMECALVPRRCAHIAVDVQRPYVVFKEEDTARRIAQLAPVFRQHAVTNYWIWLGSRHKEPDFSLVKPSRWKGDEIIRKINYSSFKETDLKEKLDRKNIDTLFVSGFMAVCCVKETLLDARRKGYQAILMTDCTDFSGLLESNEGELEMLLDRGVIFTTSKEIKDTLHFFRP